jgi:hypothetical protein
MTDYFRAGYFSPDILQRRIELCVYLGFIHVLFLYDEKYNQLGGNNIYLSISI